MGAKDGRKGRRGHGEGSVFFDERRKRWIVLLDLGSDGSGLRRRVARSARTKTEATALLRDLQAVADRGDDPRGQRRTVQDAVDDYKAQGIAGKLTDATRYKLKLYADTFADACGSRRLRELSVRDVELWLGALAAAGKSRATITTARGTAAKVLDHAVRHGWLPPERNAARLARIPDTAKPAKVRPVLTDTSITSLLTKAEEEWWYPLLVFIAATGVRVGEAAGLAWSDVDVEDSVVTIRQAVRVQSDGSLVLATPKANSSRRIALPPALTARIQAHRRIVAAAALAAGRPAPDLAFPTKAGTLADPNDLRRWLRRISKEAKVPISGFHALRHAAASSLADTGSLPIHVAALLGHANPRTTLGVYTHPVTPVAQEGLARAATLLPKTLGTVTS